MLPAEWNRPESSASRSQSLLGAIPASSLRRSSESDTFERQQPPLVLEPERPVRAEAGGRDDAMTRDDDREPVQGAERPGRGLRTRVAGEPREVGVRDDLAGRHAPERP